VRQVLHILLNLLTILSLVLAVAAAALWGRSYSAYDKALAKRGTVSDARVGYVIMTASSNCGRIQVSRTRLDAPAGSLLADLLRQRGELGSD
jgi:hypothetical protein